MSRDRLLELDQKKIAIESELKSLNDYLNGPGMPGISGSLVDAEGFPIAGLDHYQIRTARQRFNMLNNDYTDLMNTIEKELHSYFSAPSDDAAQEERKAGAAVSIETPVAEVTRPFAHITEVTENSPAFAAGIRLGDRIIKFGDVDYKASNPLAQLATLVRNSENQNIKVHLQRKNALNQMTDTTVEVRPMKWEGQGLLGCRFQPI